MQHLLLLHGAIGGKDQLQPLAEALQHDFTIHPLNFSGHGGKNIPDKAFSIGLFAQDVLQYMHQHGITQANVFGYSMGGYVGMYIAKQYPEKISRLITLATKFYWDEATAAKEVKMLDGNVLEQKVPAFARQLAQRHAPNDWKLVLEKTIELLTNLGNNNTLKPEDYFSVNIPCLLLLGDRDKMVTLDETIAVFKKLPDAQLSVLPFTPHQLEQVDIDLPAFMIRRFIK